MRVLVGLLTATLAVVAAGQTPPSAPVQPARAALPARFESYATNVLKLTPEERAQLLAGQPVSRTLPGDASREVAIFGAIWIKASIDSYVRSARDIERFESGEAFPITKKISSPPRLEDFAALRLPPDDIADLKDCKIGDCQLKLGEASMARVRQSVDWSRPDAGAQVEQLARQLMLDYVNGYLEGGNTRLAVYRDSSRPTFVQQEFQTLVDQMPSLSEYLPDFKRYLLEFPKASLPSSESFLYWQETKFGLKPTIRVSHVTIVHEPTHAAVLSKMLYASHYFWTALELRVLVPDASRGEGFWYISESRSRSDGLSGFTGALIRGKVRSESEKGMQATLQALKTRFEE